MNNNTPDNTPDAGVPVVPEIKFVNTSAARQQEAKEVALSLVDFLLTLSHIEEDMFRREMELEEKKAAMGIPEYETAPGDRELWEEYRARFRTIAEQFCTEKHNESLRKYGYGGSVSQPTEYGYLADDCEIFVTMRRSNLVTVETRYYHGINKAHRFVMRLEDDEWKLDEVRSGYPNKTTGEVASWRSTNL